MVVKRLEQPYRGNFSNSEIEQIISGYKSGNSTIELAEQFNCNKNTIEKLLRQHGIKVTKARAQAKLDTKAVIRMYEEYKTIEEIAESFNVSTGAVRRCLLANGVKIRTRWDYGAK